MKKELIELIEKLSADEIKYLYEFISKMFGGH